MKPNSTELVQGIQGALMTYILPEVQSEFARTELMLIRMLLGIVATDLDGAAQNLLDDNAALRELAVDAAEMLDDNAISGHESLPEELREAASGEAASVRVSDLRAVNESLRAAAAKLAVALEGSELPEHRQLRSAVMTHVRQELEKLPHDLMGPRADG